jgi:hypothetical protein
MLEKGSVSLLPWYAWCRRVAKIDPSIVPNAEPSERLKVQARYISEINA